MKSAGSDGSLTVVNSTTTELDTVKPIPERPLFPASETSAKTYSFFSTPNTLIHNSTEAITQYTASQTEINIEVLEPKKILEFSKAETEDKSRRLKIWEGPQERNYPTFSKYGLHYTPTPGSWNSFRSLVISGLPFKVTMAMVLDKVRGGVVIDAKLLDTTTITGGKTALITFLHERVATAFETYTKKHPLKFCDQAVDVARIQTPTWPDSPCNQKAVFDGRLTRCLSISRLPEDITPSILSKDLRVCSVMTTTRVESMAKRNGIVEVRFSSVRYADQAYGILKSICRYRHCVVRFTPDPCNQPIESISHETKHNASIFLKDIEGVDADDGKHKPYEYEDQYGRLSTVEFEVSADVARGRNTCSDM